MGWGWGHLSHSSLIYYSQQPSESGYFPILQMKKLSSGASQAAEYPEALVEMQIFGPTPDCSEFPCGGPENLHFFKQE